MKKFKIITIAVVLLLVLIVILQNTQSVETKLLFESESEVRALLLQAVKGGPVHYILSLSFWTR